MEILGAQFINMSMYVCWLALKRTGGIIPLGILAAIGSGVGMSLVTEPIFRPLAKKGNTLASFIISLAIAMIIAAHFSTVE